MYNLPSSDKLVHQPLENYESYIGSELDVFDSILLKAGDTSREKHSHDTLVSELLFDVGVHIIIVEETHSRERYLYIHDAVGHCIEVPKIGHSIVRCHGETKPDG